MRTRKEQVAERLTQMPSAYKAVYKKAIKGKSLRASINAQCLECICWHVEEIRNCTDLGCPLYAVRPYQTSSQSGHEGCFSDVESENSENQGNGGG